MNMNVKEIASPAFGGLAMTLLKSAVQLLQESGIHRPQWTAEQLLADRLGCLPVDLYVQAPAVPPEESLHYRAVVAARAGGVPLQYLLGSTDFYGRRFAVGPGVFNPRPETELLIEGVLDLLNRRIGELANWRDLGLNSPIRPVALSPFRVADVGTGSGAIAVTLAKERPDLEVVAVERSSVALHFARRNASVHGCEFHFVQGNLLEGFKPESLDAIVANPPYLDPEQAKSWPRELAWEPWLALDGGAEGVELIGTLIRQAFAVLKPQGWMVLEIGMDQASRVRALADRNGFRVERIVQDLAGLDRMVVLWKS